MKIQWCAYNVALPSAFLVTLIYWVVLYPLRAGHLSAFDTVIDVGVHAINSLLMIIDQYLSATPTRILHVYQPMTYGITYLVFSVVLWSVNGAVLYPLVLDWNNPGITMASVCGIMLYYAVAQLVLFLIYRSLEKCFNRASDAV